MPEQQNHLAQYNYEIAKLKKALRNQSIYALCLVAVPFLCWIISPYVEDKNYLGVFGLIGIFAGFGGMISLSLLLDDAFKIHRQTRYRAVATKHTAIVHARAISAFWSVGKFLIPTLNTYSPRQLEQYCKRYEEFEQIETDELKMRLEAAGVWNIGATWFNKGKTIDEALMLAVYTARLSEEETKRMATEQSLELAKGYSVIAPEPQSRKHHEQTKESAERELEKYVGARTQSEPQELNALGGQYVIHSMDGEKARIVFTLSSGEYIAELYDYREKTRDAESFTVDRNGGAYVLKLKGRGFSEHTEITLINKESGNREEIALW